MGKIIGAVILLIILFPFDYAGAGLLEDLLKGKAKLIDLTHPLKEGMPQWPGSPPFGLTQISGYEAIFYANKLNTPEHIGTHIDAPAHLVMDQATVDEIPPRLLFAPAVVIDVRDKVAKDPDYLLSREDIRAWERRHGPVKRGAFVIMFSGWQERWGDPARYSNQDEEGTLHFPGFSKDSAEFLIRERQVVGLGIDTFSVDYGKSKDFPVHYALARASRYAVENLSDLDRLPPKGAVVIIAPLKIFRGSGSPVRVLALVP